MKREIKIFKALSDANRVRILKMLERKQMCVCEITKILGLSTSNVSIHLSILREAGFISDQKNGKWVDYSINKYSDDMILNQLLALLPAWLNDDEKIIKDIKEAENVDRNIICNT